jgi:hypothetical protein
LQYGVDIIQVADNIVKTNSIAGIEFIANQFQQVLKTTSQIKQFLYDKSIIVEFEYNS